MSFRTKLSYLISGQLPEFVRTQYPQFVLFLEKYYEFLETSGNVSDVLLHADTWSDIDETLDAFIPSFLNQYAHDFPHNTILNSRRLIKYISQYYEAKGSEEATAIFFRIVFNDEVEVAYPGQYVLRASDGRWKQKKSIKLDATNWIDETQPNGISAFDLEGKIITLTYTQYVAGKGNVTSSVKTSCLSVVELLSQNQPNEGQHIYKLEVDLDPSYTFPDMAVPTKLNLEGVFGNNSFDSYIYLTVGNDVYGMLSKQIVSVAAIENGGSNFHVGDAFTINESGTTGAYFEDLTLAGRYVTDVSGPDAYVVFGLGINNAIVRVKSVHDGADEAYFEDDYVLFSVSNNYVVIATNNQIIRLQIITTGQQFDVRKDLGGYFESDFVQFSIPNPQTDWSVRTDIVPVSDFLADLQPYISGSVATIDFETGYLYVEPGQFLTNAGFVSDINRIQDNYFYQNFAYQIKSHIGFDKWKDIYTKSNHPAGFKVFNDLLIDGSLSFGMSITDNIVQHPTPTTTLAPTTTISPTTTAAPTTTTAPTTTAAPTTTLAPTTTISPTTIAPTTLAPTTIAPTTTTLAPTTTTISPTTIAPTTTTLAPTTTTLAPTTIAPTTIAPTTTTLAPTTIAPTTTTTLAPTTTVAPTTTLAPTTTTTLAPTTTTTIHPTTTVPPSTTLAPTTLAPTTTTTSCDGMSVFCLNGDAGAGCLEYVGYCVCPSGTPCIPPTTTTTIAPTTIAPTTIAPTTIPPGPTTTTTLVPTTCAPFGTNICMGHDLYNADGSCGVFIVCADTIACGGTQPAC